MLKNLLAILILMISISVNATVYETTSDGSWQNPTIWNPSKPNPTWSNSSDLIIIKHNINLNTSINLYGQTLIVENGASLNQSGNRDVTITNGSEIVVNGSMEVNNFTVNWTSPEVDLKGDLTVDSITINSGEFDNSGILEVSTYITNRGDFYNSGTVTTGSYFHNLYSNSFLDNSGTMNIGSNFTNDGDFDNSNPVNISGDFENFGDVNNSSDLIVDGNFDNNYSSNLTNTGVVSVEGNLSNFSSITNTNYMDIDGDFSSTWSTTITNSGVMEVEEDLTNLGNFVNDGGLIVDGTADSPGGAITGEGNICSTDGTDPTGNGTIDNDICGGGDDGALPVELTEFKVVNYNQFVLLNWTTAAEENNKQFEIQTSSNGKDFETIGIEKGNGNSTQIINYQFEDKSDKQNGIYYYRLKQVDFNGDFQYSPVKDVQINNNENITANVYPNPVNTGESVTIEFNKEIIAKIQIYSFEGKLINVSDIRNNKYVIDNALLKSGYYIIRIISDDQIITKKVHIIP